MLLKQIRRRVRLSEGEAGRWKEFQAGRIDTGTYSVFSGKHGPFTRTEEECGWSLAEMGGE